MTFSILRSFLISTRNRPKRNVKHDLMALKGEVLINYEETIRGR